LRLCFALSQSRFGLSNGFLASGTFESGFALGIGSGKIDVVVRYFLRRLASA
jgi:hypothetical protein